MSGVSSRVQRSIAELEQELRHVSLDGRTPFDGVLRALQRLLPAEATALCKARQKNGAEWEFDVFHWAGGVGAVEAERCFTEFLASVKGRFAWYDPKSPEPEQRNRVIEAISRIPPGELERSRIYSEVLVPLGLERHKQLRVLICEGSGLLSWFGAFIPDRVDAQQRQILRRLVPAMRERLSIEQRLRDAPRLAAALDAALEHLGAPAFILDERGNVRETNTAGRALLSGSLGRALKHELHDVVNASPEALGFERIRLEEGGRPLGFLAIAKLSTSSAASPIGRRLRTKTQAKYWGLSPRQTEVLELLASGASNLRIGSALGISERTVETHVAAILSKAQVGTRAELIATLLA